MEEDSEGEVKEKRLWPRGLEEELQANISQVLYHLSTTTLLFQWVENYLKGGSSISKYN